MRYVAAYLLAVLGGKPNPNSADIEKILGSVGIESDTEKLKLVLSALAGKSIPDLIAAGREKLSTISVGAGAATAGPAAAAAPAEEKKETKKEEEKEEEESDEDMGFTLFD